MTQRTPVALIDDTHQPFQAGDTHPPSTIPVSSESGNLIQNRADGLYYGVTPPPDIASLYVDAINGDDSAAGTRDAPMRTLSAVVARGIQGVNRFIYLAEGQTHFVDPDPYKRVIYRGGFIRVYPYGSLTDAIPDPMGGTKYDTDAALDLGTTIAALPATSYLGYQINSCIVATFNATVEYGAITFVAQGDNLSGLPRAREKGNWCDAGNGGVFNHFHCRFTASDPTAYHFNSFALLPTTVFFYYGCRFDGPGWLITEDKAITFTLSSPENTPEAWANIASRCPAMRIQTTNVGGLLTDIPPEYFTNRI